MDKEEDKYLAEYSAVLRELKQYQEGMNFIRWLVQGAMNAEDTALSEPNDVVDVNRTIYNLGLKESGMRIHGLIRIVLPKTYNIVLTEGDEEWQKRLQKLPSLRNRRPQQTQQ